MPYFPWGRKVHWLPQGQSRPSPRGPPAPGAGIPTTILMRFRVGDRKARFLIKIAHSRRGDRIVGHSDKSFAPPLAGFGGGMRFFQSTGE